MGASPPAGAFGMALSRTFHSNALPEAASEILGQGSAGGGDSAGIFEGFKAARARAVRSWSLRSWSRSQNFASVSPGSFWGSAFTNFTVPGG